MAYCRLTSGFEFHAIWFRYDDDIGVFHHFLRDISEYVRYTISTDYINNIGTANWYASVELNDDK
jgi:hypothetical protein